MPKLTPFGGVRVTLLPGLSFTLRSSNIGKLFETTKPKKASRQLELPETTRPTKRRR